MGGEPVKQVCRSPFLVVIAVALLRSCFGAPLIAQQDGLTIEVSTRAELMAAVDTAQPGTRILIAPGEYLGGISIDNLRGTQASPIILEARHAERPPVIAGGSHGIHLRRPAHVQLRGLVLQGATGNGLNIDDGGGHGEPARDILLHHIQVRDVGPTGNCDGIKLSGVDAFIIEDCTVERWGDSGSAIDMVGCHNGEITGCHFRFRSDIFGNGVKTKGGSASLAIRRCRFENAGGRAVNIGGSTGREYFRPRDAAYEAKDITVEDCTFIGSLSPIVYVGVDGAIVRYNTIYRPRRWAVRILQESQGPEFLPCRNGVFANNIVAFRSDEVRSIVNVGSGTAPETFRFAENHWYCIDNPQRSDRLGLPTSETNGSYAKDPMFRDPERGGLGISDRSPVRGAGVRPHATSE